jgi:hypothetical protein
MQACLLNEFHAQACLSTLTLLSFPRFLTSLLYLWFSKMWLKCPVHSLCLVKIFIGLTNDKTSPTDMSSMFILLVDDMSFLT